MVTSYSLPSRHCVGDDPLRAVTSGPQWMSDPYVIQQHAVSYSSKCTVLIAEQLVVKLYSWLRGKKDKSMSTRLLHHTFFVSLMDTLGSL